MVSYSARAYHDHDLLRPPMFDILREGLQRTRLERLRWRTRVYHPRLVLPHLAASAFAFCFPFAAFLGVAPRPFLLRLLAMAFVFSTYVGSKEAGYIAIWAESTCY